MDLNNNTDKLDIITIRKYINSLAYIRRYKKYKTLWVVYKTCDKYGRTTRHHKVISYLRGKTNIELERLKKIVTNYTSIPSDRSLMELQTIEPKYKKRKAKISMVS